MDNNIIGQRINALLATRDVKQKELAKELGVMDNVISYFVKGTRTPNTKQIVAIAKYFNVSTDYLLGVSGIKTMDADIKAVCEYTGLKDETVRLLHNHDHCCLIDILDEYLLMFLLDEDFIIDLEQYRFYCTLLTHARNEFYEQLDTTDVSNYDKDFLENYDGIQFDEFMPFKNKKEEEIVFEDNIQYLYDKIDLLEYKIIKKFRMIIEMMSTCECERTSRRINKFDLNDITSKKVYFDLRDGWSMNYPYTKSDRKEGVLNGNNTQEGE